MDYFASPSGDGPHSKTTMKLPMTAAEQSIIGGLASCSASAPSKPRRVGRNQGSMMRAASWPAQDTSFIWGYSSMSVDKTAPSWIDRRKNKIRAFYEDPLAKRAPKLPYGWKQYKDAEGFRYFANGRRYRTFEQPPLPSKKSEVCKGNDLIRAYQSPGIIATNIFKTCKFRCGGGFGGAIPTIWLNDTSVKNIHVHIVDKSVDSKDALPESEPLDDRFEETNAIAPPPDASERVIADADVGCSSKGVCKVSGISSFFGGPRMDEPFCAQEVDPLPRRYELTVTDNAVDPDKTGPGADFLGRVIIRAYARDGNTYNFPGDDLAAPPGLGCSIL